MSALPQTSAVRVERVTLCGERVRLEPLAAQHVPALAAVVDEGELWRLPYMPMPRADELPAFVAAAERGFEAGRELAFATVDRATDTVVGTTRFRNIEAAHRRLEIGFTFIAKRWQRSHINTEAKYLMLCHAFDHWQLNRVELLTDFRNQVSRTAIARLGAQQEGILRSHMVMRDGHVRDSVIFSLVAREWPAAKAALEARMQRTH